MTTLLTPAKNISLSDLQMIIQQLPKNGDVVKRIVAFVGQQETKFFKPEGNEPLEYVVFEWENNEWILKL